MPAAAPAFADARIHDRPDPFRSVGHPGSMTNDALTHATAAHRSYDKRRPGFGTLVLGIVQLSLLVSALVSITRRSPDRINGPKWFWYAASFVNFIGPAAYLLGGRKVD